MQNLFIISGPSGSGKDTIIEALSTALPIERVVTTTTRAPRPGESEGSPYYFVSHSDFETFIKDGALAEYAQVDNGEFYGVTKQELERASHSGKIGIWKIDYQGVLTAKKLFPTIIAILIVAPSLAILEERIRERDHSPENYIAERMAYSREWLDHLEELRKIYDYTVTNEQGKLSEAVAAVGTILRHHFRNSD